MSTTPMTGNATFVALSSVFPAQGEHIPAVTTPIRADISDGFEPVRNPVIEFVLVILLFVIE